MRSARGDYAFVTQMASGIRLSEGVTKRCKVARVGAKVFAITLTQGWNRQIRRMCEALGYTVETLRRVRIMHVKLGELPLGRWRNLTEVEIAGLLPKPAQTPGQRPPLPKHSKRPPPRHHRRR